MAVTLRSRGSLSRILWVVATLCAVRPVCVLAQQAAPADKNASVAQSQTATQAPAGQQPLHIQQKPLPVIDLALRGDLHFMLKFAHDDIQKYYYDPHYHGVDIDALYKQIDPKIDHAVNLSQGFTLVESFLESLDDSHTGFIPPQRTARESDGFRLSMIGDKCFVTQVRPKTDAAAKLHIGDQVIAYDGFNIEHSSFDMMMRYYALNTMPGVILTLKSPDGKVRTEQVKYEIVKTQNLYNWADAGNDEYWRELRSEEIDAEYSRGKIATSPQVAVWKQPNFDLTDTNVADGFRGKVNSSKALILDLRGNPGGDIEALKEMISHLFDHDVTVATLVARKPEKPMIAKGRGSFKGKLIVLVDSESASSSELLARVVQLEKRGVVIGDKTAGAVMQAKVREEQVGADRVTLYGFQISDAELIMADGKSLEKVGVTPDIVMLPTASDLASGRDPVLAYAMTQAGQQTSPEEAAKLFPFKWAPVRSDEIAPISSTSAVPVRPQMWPIE
jgi:C-terminal processing protease CtpA/Prc